MKLEWILGIQILSLSGITYCYPSFINYLLASQCLEIACIMICHAVRSMKLPELKLKNKYKQTMYVLMATTTLTVYYSKLLLGDEILMLWIACVIVRYLEQKSCITITYGEGVACGFTEGFLFQVIPPRGKWVSSYSQWLAYIRGISSECWACNTIILMFPNMVTIPIFNNILYHGIEEAIRSAESSRGVAFPLRRLLVVFPRSLHCPRNLAEFNKSDETLPSLELCQSLPDIHCDVAGVKNRVYRLTVYKIRRHRADPRPVHVVCATPINTLWMMLQKRSVYTPFALADTEEISEAVLATLQMIIRNSDELRGKCDVVYFDDMDPEVNLAEVLLQKIREIEPKYEDIGIGI